MEITLKVLADQLYDSATVDAELTHYFELAKEEDDSDIVVDEMAYKYACDHDGIIKDFISKNEISTDLDFFDDYKDESGMSLRDYLTESVMAGFPA